MGLFDTTTKLASTYAESKVAELEYKSHNLQTRLDSPDSWAETFGSTDATDRWQDRQAKRSELEVYHNIRVDGGIVSALLEARALMVFGVGGQFTDDAAGDGPAEWLNDAFDDQDLLTLDVGLDALFYGYALGEARETQAGDFGRVELIQPWTTVPKVSNKGEVLAWEQSVGRHHGREHTQEFDPDDVYHFNAMKASGRDPVGMSMLGRAMDEAEAYKDNQEAIQNAVTMHGFPKWHIKLGREDGAVIDDNELRRARPMFDDVTEVTKWLTGQDVDIDVISPESFEFEGITEHDLSKLAIAFMLPVELTQLGGGDGLGTGFPAKLRERLFLLSANAQQRSVAADLTAMAQDILLEYGPFSEAAIEDANLDYQFEEPITDVEELQTKISAIGQDLTVNERREVFDEPPVEDDDIGEQFESPGQSDPAGAGEPGAPDGPPDEMGFSLQDGRDNLSSQVLRWISDFATNDGSVDDRIDDWLTWMAEFDDEPSTKLNRANVAVSVFAADQGIVFTEAADQPVNNLIRFLERHRNLAADGEAQQSVASLLSELDTYRDGFEQIVWGDVEDAGADTGNGHGLQTPSGVPENAVGIGDRSEAPADASVVEGPRGGLYYVPGEGDGEAEGDADGDGDDGDGDVTDSTASSPEFSDDPPEEVDISNATDSANINESGLPDGGTKNDIDIVEREDGSQVFVKDFSTAVESIEENNWTGKNHDIHATEAGSAITRQLGGSTTANWFDEDSDSMLSEGVENPQGGIDDVDFDQEQLADTTAAAMLAGNRDLHYRQFVVNGDGEAVLTDHDMSGETIEGTKVARKALGTKGPVLWMDDFEAEDVWERAQEMVEENDIEGIADGLEAQGREEFADALRENAEYVRNTDFSEVEM